LNFEGWCQTTISCCGSIHEQRYVHVVIGLNCFVVYSVCFSTGLVGLSKLVLSRGGRRLLGQSSYGPFFPIRMSLRRWCLRYGMLSSRRSPIFRPPHLRPLSPPPIVFQRLQWLRLSFSFLSSCWALLKFPHHQWARKFLVKL